MKTPPMERPVKIHIFLAGRKALLVQALNAAIGEKKNVVKGFYVGTLVGSNKQSFRIDTFLLICPLVFFLA